jgi:histidinol-phosphatase
VDLVKPKNKDLVFGLEVVNQVSELIMQYFYAGVSSQTKLDGTFVTRADQEAEAFIRSAIARQYPGDAILGEEEGESKGQATTNRKWIIDPIDGTYNFTRGIPIFSTLLALEEEGEITLGIVSAPGVDDVFWAVRGMGAYKNGSPIFVSKIAKLEESQINYGSPKRIQKQNLWDGFSELIKKSYWQRCYGDYLNFAMVFEGKSEAALEVGLKPWDLAPMKILVEEAGGRYSDLSGGSSIYQGSCLVSNGLVHDACLACLMSR